ncbi:molybdate transport system substrate-binding protein [Devosia subaequoris]|uniref:Molybdate transport system substrate-binding protein n=1 Tax=Devosia subaequoris TaxID=395930 RepID=A0A7W6IN21_9HYPH|nr:molybdate transport system substrate-binding protein [Devosia subaequoris]MCP1209765.1 molybdate ABC transporter substrate-binding protein [Devosia subaequoris]
MARSTKTNVPSIVFLAFLTLSGGVVPVGAETAHVAVAANFTAVAEQLASLFEADTDHEVVLSYGATGQLFAQISQAAPFDVLLAADTARPERAVADRLAVEGSFLVYAEGRLALYAPGLDAEATLSSRNFSRIAIADPDAAPYGRAAVETLTALGLYDAIAARLVTGANITQTLQFVESGNAELGFVAASQVQGKDGYWLVPEIYHSPIAQGAVLLNEGADNPAALAFLEFLGSNEAVAVIEMAGYSVP